MGEHEGVGMGHAALCEELVLSFLRYNSAMLWEVRARVRQVVQRASLIESCAERNPAGLVDIGVRFSSPVYPGETLETSIWKLDEPGAYAFQTKVLERDLIVLSHGTARVDV
jgi:acyl dehydratase